MVLNISEATFRALDGAIHAGFDERAYRYLARYRPLHCRMLEPERMRALFRLGVRCARTYGLTLETSVHCYIAAMVTLGSRFDLDPLLPWARTILRDEGLRSETERADRLHGLLWDYVNQVAPHLGDWSSATANPALADELARLTQDAAEPITSAIEPDLEAYIARRLQAIFPAQSAHVGTVAVETHAQAAIEQAFDHDMATVTGAQVIALLTFFFGTGLAHDPMFPWASQALAASSVEQLRAGGLACLTRWHAMIAAA